MSGPRSAPSVSYPVGRCRFWAWWLLALGLGIACALLATAQTLPGAPRVVLGAVFLVWVGWALALVLRPAKGRLVWQRVVAQEAGAWRWQADLGSAAGEGLAPLSLHLVLDLQQRMLLRLRGPLGVPRWVWVEQGSAPADWLALRRAIVAQPADTSPP